MTDQLGLWPVAECDEAGDREELFRPVQYLGSKFRLLPAIEAAIEEVAPGGGRAADLFSGSGVVASYLARRRPVTAVDVQEYARVLASVLLAPASFENEEIDHLVASMRAMAKGRLATALEPVIEYEHSCLAQAREGALDPLCDVLEAGSIYGYEQGDAEVPKDFAEAMRRSAAAVRLSGSTVDGEPPLARYFGGVYFSYRQALELQFALAAVRSLPDTMRDTGVAAVLSAASEIVSTVGSHFAQPIRPRDRSGRPKRASLLAVARAKETDAVQAVERWLRRYSELAPPARTGAHEAISADYRDFLTTYDGELEVVYADPPYTRDHYSRFYHLLETLARRGDPGISTTCIGGQTRLSRGLYRTERHQSPFCIKSRAPGAFADLFTGVGQVGAPLVLSYSPYDAKDRHRPRLMTIDGIVALARQSFRHVDVVSAGPISHSKLNAAHLNVTPPAEAETLIICQP